jgi:RNA recognition motif-containing protein
LSVTIKDDFSTSTSRYLADNDDHNTQSKSHIFVGNLPFTCTEGDIMKFLGEKGVSPSKCRITYNRKTGKSRGFAYLDFESFEDASDALSKLNGLVYSDRPLKFDLASGLDDGRRGRRAPLTSKEFSLFISNVDFSLTEDIIAKLIKDVLGEEEMLRVRLICGPDGSSRGCGHVDFSSPERAKFALEKLNGIEWMDRTLRVEPSAVMKGERSLAGENVLFYTFVAVIFAFVDHFSPNHTRTVSIQAEHRRPATI